MNATKVEKCPASRRRTQEERSATTRKKVIQATIDCIVEEGLHNTTAARIAARSGVTWGAIAHQFGDKDSVLFAVVERNAEMYRGLLDTALSREGATPQQRITALIDVTWQYINEPAAFAFNELIIYNRTSGNAKVIEQQEDMSYRKMKLVWDEFFGEFNIPSARLEVARNFTLGALQGLSLMRLISHQRPAFKDEIAALNQSVVKMLVPEA